MFNQVILYAIAPLLIYSTLKNMDKTYYHTRQNPEEIELIEFIKDNSAQDAVMLFLNFEDLSLIRKTERDRFVVWKYDPVGNGIKKGEWAKRQGIKETLEKGILTWEHAFEHNKIDLVISKRKIESDRLMKIYSNKSFNVYKHNHADQ